nr:hypothetical protein [Tanacetum cinerariifolium]
MSTPKFAETRNLVAFLEKPTESEGFEQIIDFLNANLIKDALTIQALVDKKKVIITEASIRRDLRFKDEGGVDCLSNEVIFEQLTLMGSTMASAIIYHVTNQKFNFSKYIFDNMVKHLNGGVKFLMYPKFVQVFLDNQVEGMDRHNAIFVISSHTKKVFANMKRGGKDFSGKVTPLFETMMVQALKDMEEEKSRRKLKKEIEVPSPSCEIPNKEGRRMNEEDMFGLNDLNGDEVVVDVLASEKEEQSVKVVEKEVSTADPVTTAGEVVTTAAQMQAELGEKERLAKLKEEETNIALVSKWDNTQAMMDADCELAMLFNNTMKWIEASVPMDTVKTTEGSDKAVEGGEKAKEGGSKKAVDKLEQEDAKRQRIEE